MVVERLIKLQYLTGNGDIEVRNGLYSLYRTESLAFGYGLTYGVYIYKDDLTKFRLCVVCDSDIGFVAFYTNPLMVARVAQISWDIRI